MKVDELRNAAEAAPHIYLTVRRDNLPRGNRVRLTPAGGPLGRICNAKSAEGWQIDITAVWESAKVLRWLDRQEAAP